MKPYDQDDLARAEHAALLIEQLKDDEAAQTLLEIERWCGLSERHCIELIKTLEWLAKIPVNPRLRDYATLQAKADRMSVSDGQCMGRAPASSRHTAYAVRIGRSGNVVGDRIRHRSKLGGALDAGDDADG
jgi:hypothetical protein